MNYKRIEIICGPNDIAYKEENGTLIVAIGEYAKKIKKAKHTKILEGNSKWIIQETKEDNLIELNSLIK